MSKEIKVEDVYSCPRCEITSEDKRSMCPCPRGGCEAVVAGIKTITTKIILTKDK